IARREDDRAGRRRQRGAAAAAADHRRGGDFRRGRRHRPRLRAAGAGGAPRAGGCIMSGNGLRHFLDLVDIPKPVLAAMIDNSRAMKAERARGIVKAPLAGKTLAMIFDKPSTRTRVSFDVAM